MISDWDISLAFRSVSFNVRLEIVGDVLHRWHNRGLSGVDFYVMIDMTIEGLVELSVWFSNHFITGSTALLFWLWREFSCFYMKVIKTILTGWPWIAIAIGILLRSIMRGLLYVLLLINFLLERHDTASRNRAVIPRFMQTAPIDQTVCLDARFSPPSLPLFPLFLFLLRCHLCLCPGYFIVFI